MKTNKYYKLKKNRTEKNNMCDDVFAKKVDDWIYFCAEENETIYLYRLNIDGTGLKKLAENCDEIQITDDYIFYAFIYDDIDNTGIYRINVDGSEKIKINNEISQDIIVCGDWIYYQNVSDDFKPYKIRLDGSERTKLSDIECARLYLNRCGNIYATVFLEQNN